MMGLLVPIAVAALIWWFSTGIILYADRLPKATYKWTLGAASLMTLAALAGLVAVRDETTVAAAYWGFGCGLMVWAWHEMTFLMGIITGPRKTPCPANASWIERLGYATGTLIHHEIAIALTAAGLAALLWGHENQVGLWTFLVLWVMRLSAKFNIFLGVPNVTEEFLPDHMAFLKTYFTRKPMNPLFPVSVSAATIVTVLWVMTALAPDTGAFERTGLMLIAAMLALAVLEHWFLVLPLPDGQLWSWALPKDGTEHDLPAGTPRLTVVETQHGAPAPKKPTRPDHGRIALRSSVSGSTSR